jgi:hypothetical protein
MTDNVAILDGFTREVWASCDAHEGPYLIKPDTDLDGAFKAWDMDAQEFVRINGWLWAIDDAGAFDHS